MARPQVTLKIATSPDGKIALANGMSEWITGEAARAEGRKLRARHDAIAVGSNTAVLDNPQLTTRIAGQPDPIRIVFDTKLRLSGKSNLALTAKDNPVVVFCGQQLGMKSNGFKRNLLEGMGVKIILLPTASSGLNKGKLHIPLALDILKQDYKVHNLLVEGGGTLAASFLRLDAIDIIEWFRAPLILGGDGRGAIGDLDLEDLSLAQRFNRIELRELGDDIYERYERCSRA